MCIVVIDRIPGAGSIVCDRRSPREMWESAKRMVGRVSPKVMRWRLGSLTLGERVTRWETKDSDAMWCDGVCNRGQIFGGVIYSHSLYSFTALLHAASQLNAHRRCVFT